ARKTGDDTSGLATGSAALLAQTMLSRTVAKTCPEGPPGPSNALLSGSMLRIGDAPAIGDHRKLRYRSRTVAENHRRTEALTSGSATKLPAVAMHSPTLGQPPRQTRAPRSPRYAPCPTRARHCGPDHARHCPVQA